MLHWLHVDKRQRPGTVAALPFPLELRGRTPAHLYINNRRTAALVVRVAPSGTYTFRRFGLWTDADVIAADKEFPVRRREPTPYK